MPYIVEQRAAVNVISALSADCAICKSGNLCFALKCSILYDMKVCDSPHVMCFEYKTNC